MIINKKIYFLINLIKKLKEMGYMNSIFCVLMQKVYNLKLNYNTHMDKILNPKYENKKNFFAKNYKIDEEYLKKYL